MAIGNYSKEQMEKDLKTFLDRRTEIDARAEKLTPIHEHLVVVERIDWKELMSVFFTDAMAEKERVRESWVGRVLKVNEKDCGDDVREGKKKMLKKNDVVSFNPETCYSLNIEDFYEIWVIGIDNVIVIDEAFDYFGRMERKLKKRFELFNR